MWRDGGVVMDATAGEAVVVEAASVTSSASASAVANERGKATKRIR